MSKVNTWEQAVPFGYALTLTQITARLFIVVMGAPNHCCELVRQITVKRFSDSFTLFA